MLSHLVAVDGQLVGGWRRSQQKSHAVASVDLLVPLEPAEHQALEAAVRRYGAFLGLQARLDLQPAGGVRKTSGRVRPAP